MPGRRNGPKYKFIQVYGLYSITWADGSRNWKEMIGKLKTVSLGLRYVDIYIYISEGKKYEAICLLSEGSQKDDLSLEEL